jgi:hypothetical protein
LIHYGSANIPEDDTSTSGGAEDQAARPLDTQISSAENIDVVSDAAGDTMNMTVRYRDAAGAEQSDTFALNGTTTVSDALSAAAERILSITLASAPAGTVTVTGATSASTLHTFNPAETKAYIHFQEAASESGATTRYEKGFWSNEHGTLTLNSAEVTLTADPDSKLQIAIATAKDDTESVANRETSPSSVGSFTDDGVAIAVPGNALAAGEAIGVWAQLSLTGGDSAYKSSFTTELAGTTT